MMLCVKNASFRRWICVTIETTTLEKRVHCYYHHRSIANEHNPNECAQQSRFNALQMTDYDFLGVHDVAEGRKTYSNRERTKIMKNLRTYSSMTTECNNLTYAPETVCLLVHWNDD